MSAPTLRRASLLLALAGEFAAGAACQVDHAHQERVTLERVELQSGEPRSIRWSVCKEGQGTGEAINADLELRIEPLGTQAGRVEVRRWTSAAAFEDGDDPVPFDAMDVMRSDGMIRIALRPEGAFTLDGRRCTDDQHLQIEGEDVIVEPTFEARVLDWGGVIDRLVLEAELLSDSPTIDRQR